MVCLSTIASGLVEVTPQFLFLSCRPEVITLVLVGAAVNHLRTVSPVQTGLFAALGFQDCRRFIEINTSQHSSPFQQHGLQNDHIVELTPLEV